ncbi:hypothetical protein [Stenotrophomonas sp.]|uniref:hypothetical protein n=1 Tax=Stenotrophomonas sp. TaxID=69392 RepID=UPI0028978FA2|nr:hypothetical protein [Stenotrophomonas sp.]
MDTASSHALTLLLAIALQPLAAEAAEPVAFVLQADGFDTALVADSHGRLIQDWPGRPQRLAPGRWLAVDFESKRSVWFNDAGEVSRKGPYVEIRSGPFQRHVDDPDQSPLFSAWSHDGTALLRADGTAFIDWQPGSGEWTRTAHPQRYSWRSRGAGERIFDQDGRVRMALLEDERRAAGPFAGRPQYLICEMPGPGACALRDEAGGIATLENTHDLRPLENGGWLIRQGNAWRVADAKAQAADEPTRVLVDQRYFPMVSQWAGEDAPAWPRWMTEYRLHRTPDGQLEVQVDSATPGLVQADGRFVPVPGARSAEEVCPGVWRFGMGEGDQLGGPEGRLQGAVGDYAWQSVESRPALKISIAENGRRTLIDCQGRPAATHPPLQQLIVEGVGFIGTLVDEERPRLWLDAALDVHMVPKGTYIDTVNADGTLLTARDAEGNLRLYNVAQSRFVGDAFMAMQTVFEAGVVFLRDGYYGFMDRDGLERLPPVYSEITPWGSDRLWSARYADERGLGNRDVALHRMDGSVMGRWLDATVSSSPQLRDLPDQGPVTQLLFSTVETATGSYFGQQWVDREGRTLFLAMNCRNQAGASTGAVIEIQVGSPRSTGARCAIPDSVRTGMAMRAGDR